MIRSSKIWYWIVVTVVLILAAGITTLFPQTNDVSVSEEAKPLDTPNEVDSVTKVEPQQAVPASSSPDVNVDPSDKVELQQLFNDLRKEYLDTRAESVNWWLQFITIVLAFFGIVVVVLGYFGLQEFKRLRDRAKQHVEETEKDRNKVSIEFQELKNEAEQHVEEIRGQGDMISRDYQKLKRDTEQYVAEMRAHIEAVRKSREEFDQESTSVRQEATERLDALVFDVLSTDREFAELLHDFRQLPNLSTLEEAVLDAYALQQDDRIEEAIEKWRSIANIMEKKNNNLTVQAWKSVGYLYVEKDNREEALSAFDNAIRFKRNDAEVYALRGDVKALLGNYESAIVDYNEAIRWGANLEEMHSNCADAKNALHRYDEAIIDCDEAIRLNPNYIEAYILRGEARIGSTNFSNNDAAADLEIALERARGQGREDLITQIEQRLGELRSDGENS